MVERKIEKEKSPEQLEMERKKRWKETCEFAERQSLEYEKIRATWPEWKKEAMDDETNEERFNAEMELFYNYNQ